MTRVNLNTRLKNYKNRLNKIIVINFNITKSKLYKRQVKKNKLILKNWRFQKYKIVIGNNNH